MDDLPVWQRFNSDAGFAYPDPDINSEGNCRGCVRFPRPMTQSECMQGSGDQLLHELTERIWRMVIPACMVCSDEFQVAGFILACHDFDADRPVLLFDPVTAPFVE